MAGEFPLTRHSAVLAIRSSDPAQRARSSQVIARAYYAPVFKYLRLKFKRSPEDAEDLAQGFFSLAFEKGYFDAYDPAKARFRTFVRTCLDRFVANEAKAAGRIKRGGGVELLPLPIDVARLEGELRQQEIPAPEDLDTFFDREWMRSLFAVSVDVTRARLEQRNKLVYYRLLERFDLDERPGEAPSYAAVAAELGLRVSDVTNYLAAARKVLRAVVLETLRELTASDDEYRLEARGLFGLEP
jgi:DNA-directed RNA polymerase specialized sigma24 family protein